ncbi:MAG TPA: MBL fold metallo-hydrolase [Chitinophaga sp.]|uniref:MBL fold metallo-hydrolase n=1 Tax=Chitinophaga sp. TaxID=1869181 RepID=UPI002C26692B|nr:MBL fold metallo-hydrolase [Chitinophaga sp.]HVI45055.1 MBL fold metallo-hydrolase [Chitinophaga sp.]
MRKSISCLCAFLLTTTTYFNGSAQHVARQQPAQPGYYRMTLGDYEISALSDGTVPLPVDKLLTNIKPGQLDSLLAYNYQSLPTEASVNAYLINTGTQLMMVDAGTAELLGPTLGHLPESIRSAGYTPEQIKVILITHIHTDHTGGLMDGDRMVFPNATVYISKREAAYWLSDEEMKKAPADKKKYFLEARMKVAPYVKAGKVKLFDYGSELFPGVKPVATPGHTPGHTFYAVESKGQKIMFWGDIMHVSAVQFADPGVTIQFDVDPKAAAAARLKAFHEAVQEGYWLAVDHISFPGIGHLRQKGKSFEWIPINYSTSGAGQ